MCGDGSHALDNIHTGEAVGRSAVPVHDGGAVRVHVGDEACAQEEGSVVPAGSEGHANLGAGSLSGGQQTVPGLGLLGSDLGRIIVQEVVVAAAHGESVQLAILGGCSHRAFSVGCLHVVDGLVCVSGQNLGNVAIQCQQGAGSNQIVQLVVGEGEDIGSSLHVGQNGVLGSGLGFYADLDVKGLVGILGLELLHQFGKQCLIFLRTPQGQGDGSAGSGGSGRGSVTSGRGLSLSSFTAAAASGKRQDHDRCQQQSEQFFHVFFLLVLFICNRLGNRLPSI